jgi:hypothetical protein
MDLKMDLHLPEADFGKFRIWRPKEVFIQVWSGIIQQTTRSGVAQPHSQRVIPTVGKVSLFKVK